MRKFVMFIALIFCGLVAAHSLSYEEFSQMNQRMMASSPLISPLTASFIGQSYVTITGLTSGGTTVSKVELTNGNDTFEIPIIASNNTSVKCLHYGQKIGSYSAKVYYPSSFVSTLNTINYQVKIDSISPKSGNYKGGVILTIKGQNFGMTKTILKSIAIGATQCEIISNDDSQIKCITKDATDFLGTTQTVSIQQGQLVSTYDKLENVSYTFVEISNPPVISQIGSNTNKFIMGETVVVKGDNLVVSGQLTQVFVGNYQLSWNSTDTGLQFLVPYDISTQPSNLVIYVGQNGKTDNVLFEVLLKLNTVRCLNQDGKLTAMDNVLPFFALSITGKQRSSSISFVFDKTLNYNQQSSISTYSYTEVLINNLNLEVDSSRATASSLQQILVDGINVLTTPIDILQKTPNSNLELTYSIQSHPEDPKYFQIVFDTDSTYLDLDVYDVFLQTESDHDAVYFMEKEDNLTFKFPKFNNRGFLSLQVCSNYLYQNFAPQYYDDAFSAQQAITKVTANALFIAGERIDFKVPNGNMDEYFMCVLCKRVNLDNESDRDTTTLNYFQEGKDVYRVYPFASSKGVLSFYFPNLLQRKNIISDKCDITIQYAKANNRLIADDLYLKESLQKGFLTDFFNSQNGSKDFGSYFWKYSSTQKKFTGISIPTRPSIYISEISPRDISVYGGQTVTLTGKNLPQISTKKPVVSLQGVNCVVTSYTSTQIVCTSGEKQYYNVLELTPTEVKFGNISAFVAFEVRYVFNYKDQVKLLYFNDELFTYRNLYVPSFYGLIIDFGLFSNETTFAMKRFGVDGLLIFQSNTRGHQINFESIQGSGSVRFGTLQSPIQFRTIFSITEFDIADVEAYGLEIKNSSFTLSQNLIAGSNSISVSESTAQLNGDELLLLSFSLDQEDEELIATSSSQVQNQINLSASAQIARENIVETHVISSNYSISFNYSHRAIVTSRRVEISIVKTNLVSWTVLQNAKLFIGDAPTGSTIASILNSVVEIGASSNIVLFFPSIISSTIFLRNRSYWQIFTTIISWSYIKSRQISEVYFSNNSTAGLSLTNSFTSRINLNFNPYSKLTLKDNLFTRAQTCLSFGIDYSSSYQISGGSNACISQLNVGSSLPYYSVSSIQGVFLYALDVRQAFQISNVHGSQLRAQYIGSRTSASYVVIANLVRQYSINQPALALLTSQYDGYYSPQYLFNLVLNGFNLINQFTLIQKSYFEINVIDTFKIISDINISVAIFESNTLSLIFVDRDGSLTGSSQTLLSNNLVRPKYNCIQNQIGQNSCTAPLSLVKVLLDIYIPPWIGDVANEGIKVILDEFDIDSVTRIIVQGQESILRVVNATTLEDVVPFTIYINTVYSFNASSASLIRYNFSRARFTINSYYANKYTGHVQIKQQNQVFTTATCTHGQFYFDSEGVVICVKSLNVPILLQIQPLDSYPNIVPIFNDFLNLVDKQFDNSADWIENSTSFQSQRRWKILSRWNMQLLVGGIYEIPSLEIQGRLSIDLGEGNSATIRTKGIAVSGGEILIYSGNIIFELIKDGSNEIIFKYFFDKTQYTSGAFVINSAFKTDIDTPTEEFWSQYRIVSVDSNNKKLVTVSQPSDTERFRVGDTVLISSPQTSYTLQTQINTIELLSNNQLILELEDQFNDNSLYLVRSYLENDFDFRPIIARVSNQIVVKNANIVVQSYVDQVFSEIDLIGVQFIDSTILLKKWFSTFSIQDSSFITSLLSNPLNTIITVDGPILTLPNQFIDLDARIILQNNVFSAANKHLNVGRYGDESLGFYYELGYKIYTTYQVNLFTDSEALQLHKLNLTQNVFVKASQTSITLDTFGYLSGNVVIGSTQSCLSSPNLCQSTFFDQLFDCGVSGISGKCDEISSVLVARSGSVASVAQGAYSSVISIENNAHFLLSIQTVNEKNYFNRYRTIINSSVLEFNLFSAGSSCLSQSALTFSASNQSNKFIEIYTTFNNTVFKNFNCPANSVINVASTSDILPIFNLFNTSCSQCSISSSNLLSLPNSITQLPASFRGQVAYSSLFGSASSVSYFKASSSSSSFTSISAQKPFSWLAIKQVNYKSQAPKTQYQLNSDIVEVISTRDNSALAYLTSGSQYALSANQNINSIRLTYQSAQYADYIIIQLKARDSYQLLIKDQTYETILPTPFDLDDQNSDLLSLVENNTTALTCGMNVQNSNTLNNYIVLTSDENCILTFQEVLSITLKFTIATPILGPPTPEEEGKCDSDRRTIYVIYRICSLLGIDVQRARLLGKTNSICKTSRRMLSNADTESYVIIIDPIATTIPLDGSEDSAESALIQRIASDIIDIMNNIDKLSSAAAQLLGLSIGKVSVNIPPVQSSMCSSGEFQQNNACVSSCSSNYYASGNICYACSSGCNGCTGSSKYECNTCATDYYTMKDHSNNSYCGKCIDNCKTCSNDSTCNECSSNYLLSGSLCYSICPDGSYSSSSKTCSSCPSGCTTCLSGTECTSCVSGIINSSTKLCQMEAIATFDDIISTGSPLLNNIITLIVILFFTIMI